MTVHLAPDFWHFVCLAGKGPFCHMRAAKPRSDQSSRCIDTDHVLPAYKSIGNCILNQVSGMHS